MIGIVRNWRLVVGGTAAGLASVVGLAGVSASADPQTPIQPLPAPATVTVTVTPDAATPNASAAAQAVPAEQTPPAGPATIPATTAAAAPAVAPAEPITPATSGTIAEFLKEKGVAMEPEKSQGFTALNIVLPMPPGWTVVPDPNVPDAFSVIADRQGGDGLYTSNAQLVVYKLVGEFDPREAISHGYVDSQQLFAWQTTDASMSVTVANSRQCRPFGATGARFSDQPSSDSNRSALRRLHGAQQATQLSQVLAPPRLRGTTWSIVVARDPQ